MTLAENIEQIIKKTVADADTITSYREPLIGFASARDPLFTRMKQVIGSHHLHPTEMLPEAKTVVAFFLPFTADLVKANKKGKEVDRQWAVAYLETNSLIGEISGRLQQELADKGIKSAAQKATHNFNEADLTAPWSHKSAAYVAGLGTFGVNTMLITVSGCAGRFGSLVIAAEIPPTPRPSEEYCRHRRSGKCLFCVKNCPSGALTADGLKKQQCYRHLLDVDASFPDLGLCDVCGKCAVGPCALKPPAWR